MIHCNQLRGLAVLAIVLLVVLADQLEARNKKGDKLVRLGQQVEAQKDYDKALDLYEQALKLDPQDAGYQLNVRRMRFTASQSHVEAGLKAKNAGQLEVAAVEFQRAYNLDPGSTVSIQELDQVNKALEAKRRGQAPESPVEKARKESMEMIESLQPVPELRPITNSIPQLKMNNQPLRVLYETVGKLAGVNVLFDPQMQPGRNSNLDLSNVTLEQALDYIALLTKTFWKPVSSNAIFVTEDNVTKRRDYEDEVVKVFYLKNPTSVQEFQEIVTTIRSVSDVRRMFTFNAQNAVVVRDTVDKVALVEKLLHDMDKPKAEVVIDLMVMEVSSDRARTIGAGLVSSGGTTGLSVPFAFTPRNSVTVSSTGTSTTGTNSTTTSSTTTGTSSGGTAITLNNLGHISSADFATTLPGAALQAFMSDSNTRIMQSPQVRASDGQKVSLKIGDRVPYATGSFQPGVGTVGVSPLVSTQFQFVDTGVNVEITPHVHGTSEVTMHISVDISNVSSTVNLGGLNQPVISQRKNEAEIRLQDGAVSLLGGLMQSQDTLNVNGIPGLVNMPVLGKYLFGTTAKDKSRSELLIALIPHIVRAQDIQDVNIRGIAAGTDQTVKLLYASRSEEAAAPPSATAPATPVTTAPAVPGGPIRLSFVPPAVQAQLSEQVIVGLQVDNATDLAAVPIKVRWDPKILRLNQATPAGLMAQPGGNPLSLDIRNDTGEASVEISRAAGVNGSGLLMQFAFTAVGKGTSTLSVAELGLRDSQRKAITVTAPSLPVTVQ